MQRLWRVHRAQARSALVELCLVHAVDASDISVGQAILPFDAIAADLDDRALDLACARALSKLPRIVVHDYSGGSLGAESRTVGASTCTWNQDFGIVIEMGKTDEDDFLRLRLKDLPSAPPPSSGSYRLTDDNGSWAALRTGCSVCEANTQYNDVCTDANSCGTVTITSYSNGILEGRFSSLRFDGTPDVVANGTFKARPR